MSETVTERQALILWCLLGRQGEALQGEIVPKVGPGDRTALAAAGYLTVAKQGRALRLTVTDRGWDWAGRHLRAGLPANYRVLGDWLARLDAHLTATGGTLADFVGSPETPKPVEPKRPRQPSPPGKPTPARLRARIEAAYLKLTGNAKAKAVRLSALRAELADLDRATLDAGLAAIVKGDATARLSQFTDPKGLDAAERAAAYSPAGEPFHILWIQ